LRSKKGEKSYEKMKDDHLNGQKEVVFIGEVLYTAEYPNLIYFAKEILKFKIGASKI
jgi:hypothetical protein